MVIKKLLFTILFLTSCARVDKMPPEIVGKTVVGKTVHMVLCADRKCSIVFTDKTLMNLTCQKKPFNKVALDFQVLQFFEPAVIQHGTE